VIREPKRVTYDGANAPAQAAPIADRPRQAFQHRPEIAAGLRLHPHDAR